MVLSAIAGTVVGWAGSAVVANLVNTAYKYVSERKLPADSEAELKRLREALPQVTAVMGVAEAIKMKDQSAGAWVEQFRHALGAAEDVLDELEYKQLENMVKQSNKAVGSAVGMRNFLRKGWSKMKKFNPVTDDTLERLREAVRLLDQAAAGVGNFLQLARGLAEFSESWQEVSTNLPREKTAFRMAEREVFGREVEKNKIIDWLKQPTQSKLSSFGIVGIGGLGKTTLAQFAYQKMGESNCFDKRIWVCVSINFRVEDITRKILGELGESCSDGKPLNALQECLQKKILSKKILLILDDVWDDKKIVDWEQFFAPLSCVKQGSKILFTTRMESVANLLASVIDKDHESLSLEGLEKQQLRLLFNDYAFRGVKNLDNHRDLQEVGDQILKMLRGSPLAAKVIGSLLNSRMDHDYWRRILNHGSIFNLEEAKDVVEVLKLSYYHLPADLQVCFRFCSIFPQDYEFDKDELIQMWMAAGFIQQQEKRPENLGEDYFNHLLRKSFFEYSKSWRGEGYVMHDLMHELAQNVSYGECCRVEPNDKLVTIPSSVRHIFVHEGEIARVSHLENLHSLIIIGSRTMHVKPFVLPNKLIKSLRLLKIDTKHDPHYQLSEMSCCLVHLRYLSIEDYSRNQSFDWLRLVSIHKLYHLQVLRLKGDERSFNSGTEATRLSNLVKLHYMELPYEIRITIPGVHKLTSLQELSFCVGREGGYHINELGTLKDLRKLNISNIEKVVDPAEAKSANLLAKENLISLDLSWSWYINTNNGQELIIDELQPNPNLKELSIRNYQGQRSPKWMEDSTLSNLSFLHIYKCPKWEGQPFSCQMPYLKSLYITDCPNLDRLPDLPLSLTTLRIEAISLKSLSATMKRLTALKEMEICNANLLEELPELPPSLSKLTMEDARSLKSLPTTMTSLTTLDELTIKGAVLLEELSELPPSLRKLTIEDAKSLKSLPATMANLTALEWLEIQGADLLEKLSELPPRLIWKLIYNSKGEELFAEDTLFS